MKKITLALAGLCLSSSALAADPSVRIINNDRFATLTVKFQICSFTDYTSDAKCVDQAPIVLPSYLGKDSNVKNYKDITLPASQKNTFLHVDSVKAEWGSTLATGKYPYAKTCSGWTAGDAIVLDSYATDVVYCNDHNIGQAEANKK